MTADTYLKQALALAQQRQGFTAPNPAVGAVVVKAGDILGQGHHYACGEAHAEVVALQQAGDAAKDATLYVTLEPCCHQGRTPPCTQLIIHRGIKRVVYSEQDSDPRVAGLGAQQLQGAGIEVLHHPLPEISAFYHNYHYWQQHQRPWVTAKLAISLDGKIAGEQGVPVQLTGDELKELTHQQRCYADAILTTYKTVQQDNPQLNVRLKQAVIAKDVYVLDAQLNYSPHSRLSDTAKTLTLLHGPHIEPKRREALQALGFNCQQIALDNNGLDLEQVLAAIGAEGKHRLWVEAGGTLFHRLIQTQLANEAYLYIAPIWLGAKAYPALQEDKLINFTQYQQLQWLPYGNDLVCHLLI